MQEWVEGYSYLDGWNNSPEHIKNADSTYCITGEITNFLRLVEFGYISDWINFCYIFQFLPCSN